MAMEECTRTDCKAMRHEEGYVHPEPATGSRGHLQVTYPGGGFPKVLLDGQDITNLLTYDGLRVEWGDDPENASPTVTLKLAVGVQIDLDLPQAIIKALAPGLVETTQLGSKSQSGDTVVGGQPLGLSSDTGHSIGHHVCFGVVGGRSVQL